MNGTLARGHRAEPRDGIYDSIGITRHKLELLPIPAPHHAQFSYVVDTIVFIAHKVAFAGDRIDLPSPVTENVPMIVPATAPSGAN
jgi:hypothetical protein